MLIFIWVFLFLLNSASAAGESNNSPSATAHIGKGYELVQNDRYAEAAAEFRAGLALRPSASDARYQLAICLFALGERDASRKEFERLRSETRNDPNVGYYLARLDLLSGNYDAAIQRLLPLMSHPPFPDSAFYLGSACLLGGNVDAAIKWLRTAARTDPHDFRSHYRLARALQQQKMGEEAEREYSLSTQMREHYNETARQTVACVQALKSQSSDEVTSNCQRLFDPNDSDKLTTLGILYGENQRFEDALKPLSLAAKLDPESFEVFHNLGLTYFRMKEYAQARAPLEKAVALRPNFFGSNALLGATLYSLKEDEAAYQVLSFAHQLSPDDGDTTELLFRISLILADKSAAAADYGGSLKFLTTADSLRPGLPTIEDRIAELKKAGKARQ